MCNNLCSASLPINVHAAVIDNHMKLELEREQSPSHMTLPLVQEMFIRHL